MKPFLVAVLVFVAAGNVFAQETTSSPAAKEPNLANVAKQSLAIVEITIQDEIFGKGTVSGPAFCCSVTKDGKARLATQVLDPRIRPSMVVSILVYVPGLKEPLTAKYLGHDEEADVAYFEVNEKRDWKPIHFKAGSNIGKGAKVYSVGLKDRSAETVIDSAVVESVERVPDPQPVLSEGSLGPAGSVVFAQDGTAIGISTARAGMQRGSATKDFVFAGEPPFAFDDPILTTDPASWIGVLNFTTLPAGVTDLLKIGSAVMVGKVIPNTPAHKAGLKEGDFVTQLNGKELEKLATPERSMLNFVRQLMRTPAGKSVKLTYVRGASEPKEIEVTTEPNPTRPDQAPRTFVMPLGLIVREKVELDKYMDPTPTAAADGLYVVGTVNNGPSAKADIKTDPPDVVTAVGDVKVTTAAAFKEEAQHQIEAHPGEPITLTVRRGATTLSVPMTPSGEKK